MTNKNKQVGNSDHKFAASKECFEISKKLVQTQTDAGALAAGDAQ